VTDRTRAIVTISPNNPTGAVYSEASLRTVNELCRDQGLYHICDEPYEYFIYDGAAHFSPGSIDEAAAHTISLYSLSKGFGFASWRIGFMVIPEHLFFAIKKAQDTVLICPPVICQEAAVGALRIGRAYAQPYVDEMAETRRLVLDELDKLDDRVAVPHTQGAFYFLMRLNTDMDPMQMVEQLVRDYRVAAIPGTTFGIGSSCCLRISYGAIEKDTVTEGIGRLVNGLAELLG
jgi:aspartate/methionine/tyrosine aminotransferase